MRKTPWLTEASIIFLDLYIKDLLSKQIKPRVLEFGAGASTIWLYNKGVDIISIDHDSKWTEAIKKDHPHIDVRLLPRPYANICDEFCSETFDIILVDGRDRVLCIEKSMHLLKPGGCLILDNAERVNYRHAIELLKTWTAFSSEQTKPDLERFWYPSWTTKWWIKDIIVQNNKLKNN
jgi:hypothetical protein